MATSGYATLGSALVGGNDLSNELSFAQGESLAGKTQEALATARQRIRENQVRENIGDTVNKLPGMTPDLGNFLTAAIQGGVNPEATLGAQKTSRETTTRQNIANPDTSADQRQLDLASLASAPIKPYEEVGSGQYADVMHPEKAPITSDLGAAMIGEHKATTDLKTQETNHPELFHPGALNGGIGKPPANFGFVKNPDGTIQKDANDNPVLVPLTGGSKDPNAPASQGSREAVFTNRVTNAIAQGTKDLTNIVRLPSGASAGFVGIGSSPGHSVLQSTMDTLRNTLSAPEVRSYNVRGTGLMRQLAQIEAQGLAPQAGFVESMGSTQLREGDTESTKLEKLAQQRQIIETGVDGLLNNPRIPQQTKDYMKTIRDQIVKAVPFTLEDIDQLANTKGATLTDVIRARNLGTGGAPAASAAPPDTGAAAASEPTATGPNGEKAVFRGGQWVPLR